MLRMTSDGRGRRRKIDEHRTWHRMMEQDNALQYYERVCIQFQVDFISNTVRRWPIRDKGVVNDGQWIYIVRIGWIYSF